MLKGIDFSFKQFDGINAPMIDIKSYCTYVADYGGGNPIFLRMMITRECPHWLANSIFPFTEQNIESFSIPIGTITANTFRLANIEASGLS